MLARSHLWRVGSGVWGKTTTVYGRYKGWWRRRVIEVSDEKWGVLAPRDQCMLPIVFGFVTN